MARMHWIVLALLGFSLTGCVAQDKYNALKLERDQLADQLQKADSEARAARQEADTLKALLAGISGGDATKMGLISNLQAQITQLTKDNADLMAKYQDALGRVGTGGGPLPPELTSALQDFARANPDLVEFDAARGIVKFKSDVTFALGSAELTPQAKATIGKFAQILTNNAASAYELMVAGHTDSARVSNPQTIAAGHKDNWYLSAHRGIAVAEELMRNSVGANRIGVAGYADQRPVASNGSDAGRAQNRRVEVCILPTTVRGGSVASTPKTPAKVGLNKDVPPAPDAPRLPLNK